MKTMGFSAMLAAVFALVIVAPRVAADAPCNKGYRDTTAAERAKMSAVLQTVKDAMPAPSPGWVIGGDETISVPQSLCQDYALVPIDYGFSQLYRQVGDSEQRQKLINDESARQAEAYKKKQPRLEALQAKMEKLVAEQVALIQKGDMAGAEKYSAPIAAIQEEYRQVADEGVDEAAMATIGKEMNRDLELSITVRVNPLTSRAPAEAKPAALATGAKSAYRWHVEDENQSNDHALYYFGSWFKRPDGTLQPMPRKGAPFSAAHGFTIEVIGDPERVTKTLAAIDFAKVAAALE